jgi:uracil-DNA glycosylase
MSKKPGRISLTRIREDARDCRACDLYKHATQTVFGEGPVRATMMLLLGSSFKVTSHRGVFVPSPLAPRVLAMAHPSSILRAPDAEARQAEMQRFVRDLRVAAGELSSE